MLKKIFLLLDFFLPPHVNDQVDLATHFRARSIVAAALVYIFIISLLFLGSSFLESALYIRLGLLFTLITFVSLIIFLKTRIHHFELSLNVGAFVQISILFIIVYVTAFKSNEAGFFSLIWLAPLFLLTTFYFKPLYSMLFFLFNVLILFMTYLNFRSSFFTPIQKLGNSQDIYLLYSFIVITISYLLSFFFTLLNGFLKEELLKQKNLQLELAKFQSLGQMASNLAHDVNNPLFTIQGKLHQIRNLFSQDQLDLDKCDNIIEDVEGTILRLSQIVKGISTFARQSQNDQMVSVSADELIRGIVLLSSDRIVQLGITFDIKIRPETRIICYPSYVSQILINLMNNAIEALEYSDDKLIQIETFTNEKWVEIHIKDNGPGVPAGLESKIFETFFTTKKAGKGVGIGLSISKGLAEIHEGELKYQRVDNLTDFVIYLPSYE